MEMENKDEQKNKNPLLNCGQTLYQGLKEMSFNINYLQYDILKKRLKTFLITIQNLYNKTSFLNTSDKCILKCTRCHSN